jgi:hypothetical protein
MGVFYIVVDAYFGCFVATIIDITDYQVRGVTIGLILTCGYLGNIFRTVVLYALADSFSASSTIIFLCCNYLAASLCVVLMTKVIRCRGKYDSVLPTQG